MGSIFIVIIYVDSSFCQIILIRSIDKKLSLRSPRAINITRKDNSQLAGSVARIRASQGTHARLCRQALHARD